MPREKETQMPNEKPKPVIRKARIRTGSRFSIDFSTGVWPGWMTADVDKVFDVEEFKAGERDEFELRADGYGRRSWLGEEGGYGNGCIYICRLENLIFIDEALQDDLF